MRRISLLLAAAVVIVSAARVADGQQAGPQRELVATAENVTAAKSPSRRSSANAVQPGDTVRYRLTFTNLRPDSVQNVQFTDPVPAGLRYVAGSARANRPNVLVEFSIDSGRTYSERPEVEVVIDGRKERRPAPPGSYTNVRWSVRGWIRSNAQVTAEFDAQLPAATGAAVPQ
ncbi:MAG: hypothetical protein OEW77_04075 [Gemmatimonadota bacterium]|nr:hypothetical protein [Gemmatimonadota bacterium]